MRRGDLAERLDTMEHRMDSMEQRLDASFNALSTQILQSRRESNDAVLALRGEVAGEFSTLLARFESVEAAIANSRTHLETAIVDLRGAIREGDEDGRRFMLILHEEVLSRISLIGERNA